MAPRCEGSVTSAVLHGPKPLMSPTDVLLCDSLPCHGTLGKNRIDMFKQQVHLDLKNSLAF